HPALHGVLPYARLKRNTTFNPTTAEESTATQRLKLDDQRVRLIPVEPLIHKDEIDLAACISRGGCNLDEYPTFEAIQAQMAARRSTLGRQITYTWPLRNLVYCEGCDNYMHVFSTGFDYGKLADGTRVKYTKKNPAIRLKCFNMNNRSRRLAQGWKPCRPTVAVSGGEVWATVRSAIIDKLRHPDLLEAALEERQREMEAARHEAVADLATVERVQAQIDDYTRK